MQYKQPLLIAGLLLSLTTLNAEAELTPYSSAGRNLVYSSLSNTTWTADTNLLYSWELQTPNIVDTIINTVGSITDTPNYYDTPFETWSGSHALSQEDFGPWGQVSWFGAQGFVSFLNIIKYGGSNQWALPIVGADPQRGYIRDQSGSQVGRLWYGELGGGKYLYPKFVFQNLNETYWLSTEYGPIPDEAWYFDIFGGLQDFDAKVVQYIAWPVSPGLVSAVPEPGAVWLFGTGLMALLGLKRIRRAG
jgi:hypothetical protein